MKKAPPPEEKGETAPLWIISFADMISLLMAFFVMLLTMATPKSGELCNTGMDAFNKTINSFNNAISDFGIPWLLNAGGEMVPNDNYRGYPPAGGEKKAVPEVIDGRQNETEMLFSTLNKKAKTFRSPTEDLFPDFVIGPVMFEKRQTALNAQGKLFLTKFSSELNQIRENKELVLYVVGLAWDETSEQKKWITSAKRAQAVSDFLYSILPAEQKCTIYSWGAASGGHWVDRDGPVSKQSQILIAVLQESN